MSKFIDEVIIEVRAGNGGPGSVSFRKEKFAEFGGPDGGDGGKGGDVYIQSDLSVQTLDHFIPLKVYKAKSGMHGAGRNSSGVDGDDLVIKVPVGTQVHDSETDELIHDFLVEEKILLVKGGRGGKGNSFFKSSTHQTPRFAQPGEDGEIKLIRFTLKLLADVGLVGLPNAGKSTLLSKITDAHPKIAGYAFTTLIPNLGVVKRNDGLDRYTIADIPGIIEGASKGHGLGLSFLKHIERVQGIIYLFDATSIDIEEEFKMLKNELRSYNKALLKKPCMIVLNKVDIWENEPEFTKELLKKYSSMGDIIAISADKGINLDYLLDKIDEVFFKKSAKKKTKRVSKKR